MFLNFKNLFLFLLLLPVAAVRAEQIVHNVTLPDVYDLSWQGIVNLPKYDPALGELQRVDLEMYVIGVGKFAYENLENKMSYSGENRMELEVLLMRPDLSEIFRVNDTQFLDYSVDLYDGVVDFDGTSGFTNFALFQGAAENGEWSVTDLRRFVGSPSIALDAIGTLDLPVTLVSSGSLSNAGNNACAYGAATRVSFVLTYTYEPAPVCDLGLSGGDAGTAPIVVSCEGDTTTVQLNGSGSFGNEITYGWRTNCPGGSFGNKTAENPVLTFDSRLANGDPTVCTVALTVRDSFGQSSMCVSTVEVQGCNSGCTEPVDLCGVCGGNNECLQCKDVNIKSQQLNLDGGLAKMLSTLKKGVKAARKSTGKKSYGKQIIKAGSDQYNSGWTLVWSKQTTVSACRNDILCQSISNQSFDEDYLRSLNSLHSLTKQALSSFKAKNPSEAAQKKKLRKNAKKLSQELTVALGLLPEASLCGPAI